MNSMWLFMGLKQGKTLMLIRSAILAAILSGCTTTGEAPNSPECLAALDQIMCSREES